jgi:hypothetical protein
MIHWKPKLAHLAVVAALAIGSFAGCGWFLPGWFGCAW